MATYKRLDELGRGSFGTVHLCQDSAGGMYAQKTFEPSPSVEAAIKSGRVQEDELRKRFVSEAKYQSHIDHPNVVAVIDQNMDATPPYFVMELAQKTLREDLDIDVTLNGNQEAALFDILAGLEAIHEKGIYHRDLKPANVLRLKNPAGDMRYAISDFGLMKSTVGDTTTLTATGTTGGTERYAAPELMSNFKRATARSDIFSFGVILLDFFAPKVPRIPYTEVQMAGAVGKVASKCTKMVAARRYGTVAELRAALYEALKAEPPIYASTGEQHAVEALESDTELTDQQWDQIFLLLEDEDLSQKSHKRLLRLFTKDHLIWLHTNAPDLHSAYANYFCDYLDRAEGELNFDYCDVAADKLEWLFELGEVSTQARSLISLLIMGASHNRWYVESKFFRLAGTALPLSVAERVVAEIDVRELDFEHHLAHIERSISADRKNLHSGLHVLWAGNAS